MNKIKNFYLVKDEILFYIPLKQVLKIFKINKRYRNLLKLYPSIYELYYNIQNDFEPYDDEMLSYIVHFSLLQKHLSDNLLIEYFFRFLLTQKKIAVKYDSIHFGPLLDYLNSNKYKGILRVKLTEPKLDLDIRPNIEIKGENIFLEIFFNMKWIDNEKKDNIDYMKKFLDEKIVGEETRGRVKKVEFGEYINLNEETYEDFFFDEISKFPNALFNIQSNYFDDNAYWSDLDKFFELKFIINDIIDKKENLEKINNDKENKKNRKSIKENETNNKSYINGTNLDKNANKIIINNNNECKDQNNDNNENSIINKNEIKSDEKDKLCSNKINIINGINTFNAENESNNIIDENNIINENKIIDEIQDEEYITKVKRLNKNILSIRELNNFVLDFRKNKIGITDEFFSIYKNNEKTKNKIPSQITLINFIYEKDKEYFGELNNQVNSLEVVQRIYRNTPYPFHISSNLQSLKVLKLERINILEENLVTIVNSNPLLEIFEIHKNYTGYVFGFNLALALSQLQFLRSLATEFFWYKDYVPNFKTNDLVNRQEHEFFKFLTSKSIKHLSLFNETNINIMTLNQNLPNLVSLSIESANILDENINKSREINTINIKKEDTFKCKNSGEITNKRFSIRNQYKKRLSAPLIETNYKKDFNYSESDRLFHKLRDLSIILTKNSDEFFKRMAFFNKIENLCINDFEIDFFDTFVKYGYYFNNLDSLYVRPNFTDRIKSNESEKLVKNIHYFKKLTLLEIGFYSVNENLVNLLYDELIKLPLLQRLSIIVDISSDENKEILQNKINQLKTQSFNSKFLTISYYFWDKKYKRL